MEHCEKHCQKYCSDWLENTHLGPLLSLLKRSEHAYLKTHLTKYNLGSGQLIFLRVLLSKKCLNQEYFVKHFHIDKASVARSIKNLEEKKLVERKIDENNRRQYKITLTNEGYEIAKEIKKYEEEWEEMIYKESSLSKEELQNELKHLITVSMDSIHKDREKMEEKENDNGQ